jgi:Fic family protein
MQVASGPTGKERVHFAAPAAPRLDAEMKGFLDWFNGGPEIDPVLRAGVAHLWFVTIHPFDDGNGRIARAIADLCLARSEQSPPGALILLVFCRRMLGFEILVDSQEARR